MIKQQFHLRDYDWVVTFYYSVSAQDFYRVMCHLHRIGCRGEAFRIAWNNVNKGCCNLGLTYSDYIGKQSVVVVGEPSSFGQLMNSLSHEIHHLSVHIAIAHGLDLAGEEVCYIHGDVTQRVFELPISGTSYNILAIACASFPWSEESYTDNSCRLVCSRTIR